MQEARIVPIKGSVEAGVRPHINFHSVKYTSAVLATNAALINRKLRIYYDVRDIRAVKAFFEDGTELGILTASRPWHITPHSLRIRQEIFRLVAERKLIVERDECPVVAWGRYKWRQAKGNKRAANALAKHQSDLAAMSQALPPASDTRQVEIPAQAGIPAVESSPAISAESTSASTSGQPRASPKPKPMHIKRTITF
jgi:hypothetical protein